MILNTFVVLAYLVGIFARCSAENEQNLNLAKALEKVLPSWGIGAASGLESRNNESKSYAGGSSIGSMCSSFAKEDRDRIGCCKPHNVQYLHNVRVRQKDIVYFTGNSSISLSPKQERHLRLYPIANVEKRNTKNFQVCVYVCVCMCDPTINLLTMTISLTCMSSCLSLPKQAITTPKTFKGECACV